MSSEKEGFDLIKYEYDFNLSAEENTEKWIEEYKKIYGEPPKKDKED